MSLTRYAPSLPCSVKVVDKRVRGGRLYLKKGTIVDVKAPTGVCDGVLLAHACCSAAGRCCDGWS